MLYVGLVLGIAAENIAAHAAGLNALRVYIATLVLIVPALVGARLLYVLAEWSVYRENLPRIWDRRDGGGIMLGGLPLSLLLSVPLLHLLHLSIPAFWDVAVFTFLVGMFFGRIGCLLNGCCAGRSTTTWLGLYLPDCSGVWKKRIPTQLLEALWTMALLVCAIAVRRSLPFPGALFLLVALGYASGRLVLDFARAQQSKVGGFGVASAISLTLALVSISALTLYWRS